MIRFLVVIAFAAYASGCLAQTAGQQSVMEAVQRSHIDANVPAAADFDRLLERDLLAYVRGSIDPSITSVQYRLLRDRPTQSGVAYPKYYAWIKAFAGPQVVKEGAVRVAAIAQTRFEVTDFLSGEQIRSDPQAVGMIFPAPLVAGIQSLAAAK